MTTGPILTSLFARNVLPGAARARRCGQFDGGIQSIVSWDDDSEFVQGGLDIALDHLVAKPEGFTERTKRLLLPGTGRTRDTLDAQRTEWVALTRQVEELVNQSTSGATSPRIALDG